MRPGHPPNRHVPPPTLENTPRRRVSPAWHPFRSAVAHRGSPSPNRARGDLSRHPPLLSAHVPSAPASGDQPHLRVLPRARRTPWEKQHGSSSAKRRSLPAFHDDDDDGEVTWLRGSDGLVPTDLTTGSDGEVTWLRSIGLRSIGLRSIGGLSWSIPARPYSHPSQDRIPMISDRFGPEV